MKDLENVEWSFYELPNIPIYDTKLPKNMIDVLWGYVDKATERLNHRLAGNITGSLGLKDKDDFFLNNVTGPLTNKIVSTDPKNFAPPVDVDLQNKFEAKLSMNWWVNYQYQTEFNPEHAHTGITSFVVWMKIPTRYQEQHNLPFHSKAASDFQFTYSNILGNVVEFPIYMEPEMEGVMMLFPSNLHHQVYPFYNTEEPRISISGNLLWNMVELK